VCYNPDAKFIDKLNPRKKVTHDFPAKDVEIPLDVHHFRRLHFRRRRNRHHHHHHHRRRRRRRRRRPFQSPIWGNKQVRIKGLKAILTSYCDP